MRTTLERLLAVQDQLNNCLTAVRPAVRREIDRLRDQCTAGQGCSEDNLSNLENRVHDSRRMRDRRTRLRPEITFPADLPIAEEVHRIARTIEEHSVVIVSGETGSGKTTQLPKICLSLGLGDAGLIGHTQPRRIAARSIARRVAEELRTETGYLVGYKVRFNDRTHADTMIKVMTDGILLAEIQADRDLLAYQCLIIDEAHDRSLNIDFLLGYLKKLLPRRPELKVVVCSATIDTARFSAHFDNAPVIEVSGRTYPVEIRYRPLDSDHDAIDAKGERDQIQAILDAIDEIALAGEGDVLVFLSGEREIRDTAEALRKHHPPHTEILPLYARLGTAEQQRVFAPHRGRRIVLATNVAETSLTVPGIRFVIDTGYARISRYSYRSKILRLPIEPISRAAADQRAGRCGRVCAGICVRLYSEVDYLSRPEFPEAEILRANLASVILQMSVQRLGDVERFPFIEQPDPRQVRAGRRLLTELGAIGPDNMVTDVGRRMGRLSVDPRFARMLLAAAENDCLGEMLVIVSALSIPEPRERPPGAEAQADARHQEFSNERSDFLAFLLLWRAFDERYQHLSQRKLRKYCKEHFVSYRRMCDWRDIWRQLHEQMSALGARVNQVASEYGTLHKAILTGLLSNIGVLDEHGEYTAGRGGRLAVFPGSGLHRKRPRWIMAAELVETRRLYAHCVAAIEPAWVEEVAAHLVKRSYHDPRWDRRSGRVIAYERIVLNGLVVNPRRRCGYGAIDPRQAREIFIREGLINGEIDLRAAFLRHNHALLAEVRRLEDKSRRLDVAADEERLLEFYDYRLPPDSYDVRRFERWRKQAEKDDPELLFMARADVLTNPEFVADTTSFPDTLQYNGSSFAVHYVFAPGDPDDGVTLIVPLTAINQVDSGATEWLVPGRLLEKIIALIRALPKHLRKHFVPVPEVAATCYGAMDRRDGPLLAALTARLKALTGIDVPAEAWNATGLPEHLRMNFHIVDAAGHTVGSGRDIDALRRDLGREAQASFATHARHALERSGITSWDFDPLPETVELRQQGMVVRAFPGLADEGESVAIRLFDTLETARAETCAGVERLVRIACRDRLRVLAKEVAQLDTMCLHYAALGSCTELREELLGQVIRLAFLEDADLPGDAEGYRRILETGRQKLHAVAHQFFSLAAETLKLAHEVRKRLARPLNPHAIEAIRDMRTQFDLLIHKAFLSSTQFTRLRHYPRYLQGMIVRLDKLEHDPLRDRARLAQFLPLWERYQALHADDTPEDIRWLLEELRISLFAQELKTAERVSIQRIDRLLEIHRSTIP